MATAVLPQKRVLGESRSQNIPSSPASAKKRKTDIIPSSSPAVPRFTSSQNGLRGKLASSQPKSTFEVEELEKLSQNISSLKQSNTERDQMWDRPPVGDFVPERHSLCFQSIEAEEGSLHGGRATVKLFGVNDRGNSVMLQVFNNPDLPESEKSAQRIQDESQLVIGAGLSTTGWAAAVASYHILSNPEILQRLRAELFSL